MASSFRISIRNSQTSPDDIPVLIAGGLAIAGVLAVVAYALDASALDVWTAAIVFLVLVAGSVPLFRWVARKEGDPWLFKVLFIALIVHLVFSLIRYFVIFVVYKGSADAGVYNEAGITFARHLRDGDPVHPIDVMKGFPPESQRIGDFVGVLYTVIGPSAYAAFFIFSYICFWGQVLVVRAFRVAVPEGDHRRFAILCLFLPSLLFWPASIGKEALMIGCLGVIVYGGALLLAPKPKLRGAAYFVVGILLVLLVRPHVAAMSLGALGLALAVGTIGGSRLSDQNADADAAKSSGRVRAVRMVGVVALVLLAGVVSTRLSEQFNEYSGSSDGTEAALSKTLKQTSLGNSEFTPAAITGPTRVPAGVVSVLFRPFPWEARNFNSLIAAGESAILVALLAVGWRRLLSLPKLILRRPFLVFCGIYILLFSIGFSFIGNFGILARQRVQVMPIVLVMLALPVASLTPAHLRGKSPRGSSAGTSSDADSVGAMTGVRAETL